MNDALCDVTATITTAGETVHFRGRGYHDHTYGTAPLAEGFTRYLSGRAYTADAIFAFQYAQSRVASHTSLRELNSTTVSQVAVEHIECVGSANHYPQVLQFDEILRLANPRPVETSRFNVRLRYDALIRGQRAQAICNAIITGK